MASTVFLRSVSDMSVEQAVREVLEGCRWQQLIRSDARVVIKPNLNTSVPAKVASANTDPRIVEAVVRALQERTGQILIGEADGPRHTADEAFAASGLVELSQRLGIPLLNFSRSPSRPVPHAYLKGFELPVAVLDADILISLPVVKTHALTVFTGSLKNQWGCVPRRDRILLHRYLDLLLADLQGILRPALAIMDGIVGVEGRGPTNGKPRRLDVVLGSTDLVALDATTMRLIGLEPRTCAHLLLAHESGHGRLDPSEIAIDGDFERHRTQFEPAALDWAVRSMNYLTRYQFFTYRILFNDAIFYPTKRVVQLLRQARVL